MTADTRERLRSLRDLRIRALVGEPGPELVRFCRDCGTSFDIEPGGKAKLCDGCRYHRVADMPIVDLLRRRQRQRVEWHNRAAQRCASRA